MKFVRTLLLLICLIPFAALAQGDSLSEARTAFDDGEYEMALDLYNVILRETPENIDALIGRGRTHLQLENNESATEDMEAALELDPENAEVYILRGLISLTDEDADLETALEEFERATSLDRNNAESYFLQGLVYSALGETNQAFANIDRAIDNDPENSDYVYQRALLKAATGDTQGAMEDFELALEIDPDNADVYFTRANMHYNQGDLDAALADSDRVIELDPERPSAWLNRGFYAFAAGEIEQATTDYYEWVLRTETERFELDPLESGAREEYVMDTGYVYIIPFEVEAASVINVDAFSPGGLVDPLILILDEDMEPIIVDDDGGRSMASSLENYALPYAGEYFIMLSHAGGGSVGDVILTLDLELNIGNA